MQADWNFTVNRPGIKSIRIRGNNNEALAGTYKASFGSDGKPSIQVISSAKEVTLVAPSESAFTPGDHYLVSLLPVSLSNGVTIIMTTSSGAKGTIISSKKQIVKRSVFGVLKNIDAKAQWDSNEGEPEAVDFD